MQRDQFNHSHLALQDQDLILQKHATSIKGHESSELYKSRGSGVRQSESINIGDLVHIIGDRNKHHPRERYIVTSLEGNWCQLRKFTGSQLRANAYKVPLSEVYKVPSQCQQGKALHNIELEDDSIIIQAPRLPATTETQEALPPVERDTTIPEEISAIPTQTASPEPAMDMSPDIDPAIDISPDIEPEIALDTLPASPPDDRDLLVSEQGLRRSTRIRGRPAYLKDYEE